MHNKRFLVLAALLVPFAAPTAKADFLYNTNFSVNGGMNGFQPINSFQDMAGSFLADGGVTASETFQATAMSSTSNGITTYTGGVQTPFSVYYQSVMASFNSTGPQTTLILNAKELGLGTSDFTMVITGQEVLTGITVNNNTHQVTDDFALAPGPSYVQIYYNKTSTVNPFQGTYVNSSSELVLSGTATNFVGPSTFADTLNNSNSGFVTQTFDQFGGDGTAKAYWAATTPNTVTGNGVTSIDFAISSLNSSFFELTNGQTDLTINLFNPQLGTPFSAVAPSKEFVDTNVSTLGPVIPATDGAINGASGPDFEAQSQGLGSFTTLTTAVPEPSSSLLALFAVLSVGVGGSIRRWRQRLSRAG